MTGPPLFSRASCRVVKVGGSLLSLPRLECALNQWFDRQHRRTDNLLVVGGGELADAVRELDRQSTLDAATAHWMAIRAMQVNGFALYQILKDAEWVTDSCHWCDQHASSRGRRIGVVAIEEFLKSREPHPPDTPSTPLPVGWHVTSDSIAARLAEVVRAEELVLLKSTLPETSSASMSICQAVAERLIDAHFPTSAANLPRIRVVNLRAADYAELRLVPQQPRFG